MKVQKEYSFVRGVNYEYEGKTPEIWRSQLLMGKRAALNSVRIWLRFPLYEKDPEGYICYIKSFFDVCRETGYTVMPILFNGNAIDPANLYAFEPSFKERGEKYVDDIIAAFKDDPALLMYDVMNEPSCNHFVNDAPSMEQRGANMSIVLRFVRYYCEYLKAHDPRNAITVGNTYAYEISDTGDFVDVLSYHDYSPSSVLIIEKAELALKESKRLGKPVLNTETGCFGRGNRYETELRILNERGIPWFFYGLTTDGYWSGIHGIFNTDGTVRDPEALLALFGLYRNYDIKTIVPEKPNREKLAAQSLEKLARALDDSTNDGFQYREKDVHHLLNAMDEVANFLEAGQLVPMHVPPTARIYAWRREKTPNVLEIREYAYKLAKALEAACQIL